MGKLINVDVNDNLIYTFNFGTFLATGETITVKAVTTTGGATAGTSAITSGTKPVNGVATSVALGAVTAFCTVASLPATLTAHITTSLGQETELTYSFNIIDR